MEKAKMPSKYLFISMAPYFNNSDSLNIEIEIGTALALMS